MTSSHRLSTRFVTRAGVAAFLVGGSLLGCAAPFGDVASKWASPFTLFGRDDMRAGLRYEVMEQTARKESSKPLDCFPLWAKARRCSVEIEPGMLVSVVDSTGRIIRLSVTSDARIVRGQNLHGQIILRDAIKEMRASWDSIGPARREAADESPPQRRWLGGGGRWGAAIWYSMPRAAARVAPSDAELAIATPDSFGITDLPAYARLLQLRPPDPKPRVRTALVEPPPPPPTPEQLIVSMRADLRELTIAQEGAIHGSGRYEVELSRLRVASSAGVRLVLLDPTIDGWSAVATHPSLPGLSCVVHAGIVTERPRTKKSRLTGVAGEVVCDAP